MAQAEQKAGYRGRWKKWLLLYLAIGAIVYLVVYFVFFHGGGGYGGGGSGGDGGGGGGGRYTLLVPSLYLLDRARTWFCHRWGGARPRR
jgi:hypothetical protein